MYISQTNEVNAGDALEHDFSCMYAALQLPLLHLLSSDFSQVNNYINALQMIQHKRNPTLNQWSYRKNSYSITSKNLKDFDVMQCNTPEKNVQNVNFRGQFKAPRR